jgi:hypothetical protein
MIISNVKTRLVFMFDPVLISHENNIIFREPKWFNMDLSRTGL